MRENDRKFKRFPSRRQSLEVEDSNQHSEFPRKVSRVFLGNSIFAESEGGDWFECRLGGGGASGGSNFARIGPANGGKRTSCEKYYPNSTSCTCFLMRSNDPRVLASKLNDGSIARAFILSETAFRTWRFLDTSLK
jgi:hypothetical protein